MSARGNAELASALIGAFAGGGLRSYVTSIVVMALASVDAERFHDEILDARTWLETAQWDQGEGLSIRQD